MDNAATASIGKERLHHKLARLLMLLFHLALIVIVIGGLVYGVHYLAKKTHKQTTNTTQSSPSTSTSAPSNSSQSSTSITPSSNQNNTNTNNQLSNTGPGSSEITVFVVASAAGTLAYYIFQKRRLTGR